MEKARYLRNQAFMCLQIAQQTSDLAAAERWLIAAGQYFGQAAQLEKQKCVADIRAGIGEELRTELAPTNPLPGSMLKLLSDIDGLLP